MIYEANWWLSEGFTNMASGYCVELRALCNMYIERRLWENCITYSTDHHTSYIYLVTWEEIVHVWLICWRLIVDEVVRAGIRVLRQVLRICRRRGVIRVVGSLGLELGVWGLGWCMWCRLGPIRWPFRWESWGWSRIGARSFVGVVAGKASTSGRSL